MRYAVRANIIGLPTTEEQHQDIKDFLSARRDITVETLTGNPFRIRFFCEAKNEMNALHRGMEALMVALEAITAWEGCDETPQILAFSKAAPPE